MGEFGDGLAVGKELRAAADRGDVLEVIERLYRTGIYDGLVRQINSIWTYLDPQTADMCVSEAVDTLWEALRRGDRVDEPRAFLYRVAMRNAGHAKQREEKRGDVEATYTEALQFENDKDVRARRRALRIQAINVARELLGQVGQVNAQRVMALVLDAVEQDRSDLSVTEIADTLRMTPEAARKNLERGMERLARAARDAGVLPADVVVIADDIVMFDEEDV